MHRCTSPGEKNKALNQSDGTGHGEDDLGPGCIVTIWKQKHLDGESIVSLDISLQTGVKSIQLTPASLERFTQHTWK